MEMIHEAGQYVDTVKRVCGAVGEDVTFRGTVCTACAICRTLRSSSCALSAA